VPSNNKSLSINLFDNEHIKQASSVRNSYLESLQHKFVTLHVKCFYCKYIFYYVLSNYVLLYIWSCSIKHTIACKNTNSKNVYKIIFIHKTILAYLSGNGSFHVVTNLTFSQMYINSFRMNLYFLRTSHWFVSSFL